MRLHKRTALLLSDWKVSARVFNAAVQKPYGGKRKIEWFRDSLACHDAGYMGWTEAADRILSALGKTIQSKVVTYDFARLMEGAKEVKCSEFGTAIIKNMG